MEDVIFFNHSKYIKEMLKKFGLEDSKPMKTPMSSDTKLTKDKECVYVLFKMASKFDKKLEFYTKVRVTVALGAQKAIKKLTTATSKLDLREGEKDTKKYQHNKFELFRSYDTGGENSDEKGAHQNQNTSHS
ncbi:hypothetical protein Tco_0214525 [Tanacetum coccineum]